MGVWYSKVMVYNGVRLCGVGKSDGYKACVNWGLRVGLGWVYGIVR